VPRPYSIVRLHQFDQDMMGVDAARRALVRAALDVLKVDPKHALDVFPIYVDRSSGWERRLLVFPSERGELEYSIETYERVIVLYRVRWGRGG
jgi:hypothetical protein